MTIHRIFVRDNLQKEVVKEKCLAKTPWAHAQCRCLESYWGYVILVPLKMLRNITRIIAGLYMCKCVDISNFPTSSTAVGFAGL